MTLFANVESLLTRLSIRNAVYLEPCMRLLRGFLLVLLREFAQRSSTNNSSPRWQDKTDQFDNTKRLYVR